MAASPSAALIHFPRSFALHQLLELRRRQGRIVKDAGKGLRLRGIQVEHALIQQDIDGLLGGAFGDEGTEGLPARHRRLLDQSLGLKRHPQ
jgi:hypothetical protein